MRRELEFAEPVVLIAGHCRPRIPAGQAFRKDDHLDQRQRFAPRSYRHVQSLRMTGGSKAIGQVPGRQLARDLVGAGRPEAADVAAGCRETAGNVRAVDSAARPVDSGGSAGSWHGARKGRRRDARKQKGGASHTGHDTRMASGRATVGRPTHRSSPLARWGERVAGLRPARGATRGQPLAGQAELRPDRAPRCSPRTSRAASARRLRA